MHDLEQQLYDLYARRGEAKSEADRYTAEVKEYDNQMSLLVAQLPDMKHTIKGVASFGISASSSGYTYDKAEIDQIIEVLERGLAWGRDEIRILDVVNMLKDARKETSRAGGFYCRPAKEINRV